MRVIIIALSCFFLIITAFSMKKKLDYDLQSIDNSDHVLHKIIEKLKREMSIIAETHNKEFVDAEDWANSEIQKKTSNEDIKVRINTRGIKYMFEQLMLTIRHDSMRHPPSTILASYLGMELRINFIQIVDFVVPELHMEYVTPSIIRFSTSGGSLRYLGLYSAVYKTTREGQFEALLENMQIELTLEFDMHNGSYMVSKIFIVIEYAGKITNLTQNLAAVEDTIALKQTEQRLCLLKHELISVTVDEYGILMLFRKSDSKRVKSMPIESEYFLISFLETPIIVFQWRPPIDN
uniref:BPI1 domain-containing protein n=1 Tax=Heterorhabditis bacteriophora TaxID=37862 RepID=A0A1I7XPC9_HETBA